MSTQQVQTSAAQAPATSAAQAPATSAAQAPATSAAQAPATSAAQAPATSAAEEEYHAIKIGNNYVLVNETADKVHLASVRGLNIGDYNMVKIAVVDGNYKIIKVKNNQDTDFQPVPIEKTCAVPPPVVTTNISNQPSPFNRQNRITFGDVLGAANGAMKVATALMPRSGGAPSRILLKYKCLNKLLNTTTSASMIPIKTLFGESQKLKILPLVQVGETYIILLYQENHEFMFLTSSDLLSVHDDTMAKIIRNPMSELNITAITNIEQSKQLGIPIMTVRANINTYGENSSVVIRMYVFPIEANLKDPNAPGSVANIGNSVAKAFGALKPAGEGIGIGATLGAAATTTTKGVGAAATAIGKGYSPYFSKVGITYTENEKAALDKARTKFICKLRNLLKPASEFIESITAEEKKRAAMFAFITNANQINSTNLINTLNLSSYGKTLDISQYKLLDDGSVYYKYSPVLDSYFEYKKQLNTIDASDLINNDEYKRLSKIIVVLHTLRKNFVKLKVYKETSDIFLGYTVLFEKLPKAVGAESAGRAFFSWLAKGTLGVGTALSVPVIGAVKTTLWDAPKAALWDAPRAGIRKASMGSAAAMFKPSPKPVDKAANGGGNRSLARAKVRKSRRAK